MAKDKIGKSITNKHLHARTTFLYQAATYLTLQASSDTAKADDTSEKASKRGHSGLALQLVSHLRTVSLKGQTRLSAKLKRSMCKACNSILVLGRTSTCSVENGSKDGKKPWADVMVVECNMCGSRKRYPVGAVRQNRKTYR
ncbi:Rpr2-domain-containing protein, partial [Lojkania enalia]